MPNIITTIAEKTKKLEKALQQKIVLQAQKDLIDFLPQSITLEEPRPPQSVYLTMILISAFVFVFIIWAAITPVHEVSVAQGQIIPTGSTKTIQHLEGGIITNIAVKDGDYVKAGDLLLNVDGKSFQSELLQAQSKLIGLKLKRERLIAFVENREPKFIDVPDDQKKLVQEERAHFDQQIQSKKSQLHVLESQLLQKKAEFDVLASQESAMRKQNALINEQISIRKPLVEQQLISKSQWLDLQRTQAQSQKDLAQLLAQKIQSQASIKEAETRTTELLEKLKQEALNDAGNITTEIEITQKALVNFNDKVSRLTIKAPIDGYVKGLNAHTIGGVIAPGSELMQIVPVDAPLVAEVHIPVRDIGHIRNNLPAVIKLTAFDSSRYGNIDGTLTTVSATTFLDEKKEPYYRAEIALHKNYVGKEFGKHTIFPGMTLTAEIKTGEKTILDYLMKPVYNALHDSFKER